MSEKSARMSTDERAIREVVGIKAAEIMEMATRIDLAVAVVISSVGEKPITISNIDRELTALLLSATALIIVTEEGISISTCDIAGLPTIGNG